MVSYKALKTVIVIISETIGLWFLNCYLKIPQGREFAANVVYQMSILAFIVNLFSVPYNASIIAHERMTAFAYISIFDATLKLLIAYIILNSSADRLIFYSVLIVVATITTRLIYVIYCRRSFPECRYQISWNKDIMKNMVKFAGWSFLPNFIWVLNTNGINFLMNIFFGVNVNAARGFANQIENALKKFVVDFTTAINPQIIKNYSTGNQNDMFALVCRGARFSFFLLLCFALPLFIETESFLKIWLGIVPEHTILFFRLSIIATLIDLMGNSLFISFQATGDIKKYMRIESFIGCIAFPLTWLLYSMGMSSEVSYMVFIGTNLLVYVSRILMSKQIVRFNPLSYIINVLLRVIPTALISIVIPLIIFYIVDDYLVRLISVTGTSIFSCILSIYFIGLTKEEKLYLINLVYKKLRKENNYDSISRP